MPPKSPPSEHPELFRSALVNLVDRRHPLTRLAGLIDWDRFATAFGPLYRDGVGRPGLPTRLMVGLHLIKHMDGLSDDAVCTRLLDSPYVQLFCGESHFQHALPLDRSSMTRWRKRVGAERLELLLAETLAAAQRTGAAEPKHFERVSVDTTVQPKAVTHPTDARSFRNLDDLNQQFQQWLETVANARRHATTGRIVSEAFAEERGELRQLPQHRYQAVLSLERRISHEGMVRVGGNLYSVPETARRRVLEVQCLADEIRILEAGAVIARHVALEGRGQSVVDPAHRTARPAETRRAAQLEELAPRAGERVTPRSLDFYDAVGRRLAVAGRA